MAWLLLCILALGTQAMEIGLLQVPAYSSLVASLLSPLSPAPSFRPLDSYSALDSCLHSTCDLVLLPSPELPYIAGPATNALFRERLVTVVKDSRGRYAKQVLWEFFVLLATIWLPGVLLVSQVLYLVEIRRNGKPGYVYGSLIACWATFNVAKVKRDSSKLILALSWLFLAFLLLLIFLDLASVHSSRNAESALNSSAIYSKKVCTTATWRRYIPAASLLVDTVDECITSVQSNECDLAVLGRMELIWSQVDEDDLIFQEFLAGEITFHLTTLYSSPFSSQIPLITTEIASLWTTGHIPEVMHSFSTDNYRSAYNRSPLLLSSPEAVFTGLSVLLVFILLLLILAIKDLALRKERAVQTKLPEARPLKQDMGSMPRSGNTLSLGSFSPKDGAGRPGEDWMQAVPVDDAHVQGIQNMQEYENELSAVPQANPSLGVSDSVFSLFKVDKKK